MNKKEIERFVKNYRFSYKDMIAFAEYVSEKDWSLDAVCNWMTVFGRITQKKLDEAKYHREQAEAGNCA